MRIDEVGISAIMIEKIKEVYELLEDEISKNVFLRRLEYNITKSKESMQSLLEFTSEPIRKNAKLQHWSGIDERERKPIIIYGRGRIGKSIIKKIIEKYPTRKVLFCDRKYSDSEKIDGIEIISPKKLVSDYLDGVVVIATTVYFEEVYNLVSKYFVDEKIYLPTIKYDEDCYFVKELLKPCENEVFVDGGSYDGQTALEFAKWCKFYRKIYIFEPEKDQIKQLKLNIEQLKNVEIHEVGLWDKEHTLEFKIAKNGGSRIVEAKGDIRINVNSIDNICKVPVTFIKLDVEGAELKALQGAEKTIKENKPKMAVCAYHKSEDIIDIPLYIKELDPDYKIYMRHHSGDFHDTIVYAV